MRVRAVIAMTEPSGMNAREEDMANILKEQAAPNVVLLRLNRPEARNALSPELREELRDHFLALDRDANCRAIVVTGDMRAFAAGADIKVMADATPAEMMERDDETNWAAIRNCSKPVIAAVNGYALGGGCELAMHCDIIIAGKNAKFGQPEVKLGIMPGAGGTQRLTRAIGKFRAMQLLLTGDFLSAEEAHVAGLVSSVSEDEAVVDDALALAARIAALPPLAVAEIKRVVLTGMDMPLEAALKLEMRSAYLLFGTADKSEAMRAFVEKRPAVFTGK